MTVDDFMTQVNYALRGEDDETPVSGDDSWNYWLATANRKKSELYRDTKHNWSDTYEVRSLGTVTVDATPTFNAATALLKPAEQVYVLTTGSDTVYYDLVTPNQHSTSVRQAYLSGNNPRVLTLTTPVLTGETIVSGTLYLPGYYEPDDMEDDTDVVPTLDPYWLVMATAADVAFNDLTYEDKFDDLNNKANALYRQMTTKNRTNGYNNPRTSATNVYRIRGFR